MTEQDKGELEECEYSKPAYQGAQHLRTCIAYGKIANYHCIEKAWKEHYKECLIRKQVLDAGIPEPAPEEKVPEPIKWDDIFRKPPIVEEPKQ